MKVLLVGSDALFLGALRAGLSRLGYRCVIADADAGELAASREYSAAVVDCDWAEALGFLSELRRVAPGTAALAVTSAADVATSVGLLRGGETALALDYIEKPVVDIEERIDAALSRHFRFIRRGGFGVDLDKRQAFYDDRPIALHEREMDLFLAFMRFPHRDLLHTDLGREVYGKRVSFEEAYTALRSPMSRLRQALRAAAGREVLSRHDVDRGIRFVPEGHIPRPRRER